MPQSVPEQVEIAPPSGPPGRDRVLGFGWAAMLATSLKPVFYSLGQRLNGSLHKDGQVGMDAPFKLKQYTMATRPDPTEYPDTIIAVSDGGAGAYFQGSDGTNWVDLG